MKRLRTDPFYSIVLPLAIAETIVWATVYYSFPAMLLEWEKNLGWSKTQLSGAFTLSLIVSALLAPAVGRLIDQGNGTMIFSESALLGAVCLALLSGINTLWHFYLLWFFLGIAMAGMLYEACFALLTHSLGTQSKRAITMITLIAGFAGTLAFPGTHFLVGIIGWRGTMVALASIVLLVALPLFRFGCRRAERGISQRQSVVNSEVTKNFQVNYKATFWLLAVGFVSIALNHGVLLTHLLPLLDERGIQSGVAIFAASMIGPMQVAGRLGMLAVERHLSTLYIFAGCFIAMSIASMALLEAGVFPFLLVGFVLLQGAGYGATSIMRPVVTAELLGSQNFGFTAGLLAVPFLGAAAAAPTVAALIWRVGGYDLVIWFATAMAVLGLASLLSAAALNNDASR